MKMKDKKELGKAGETLAAIYLEEKGFKILERNFNTRFGELDIIAEKDGVIHYVEVKTRGSGRFGRPAEAVNEAKLRKMEKTALIYRAKSRLPQVDESMDVIAINLDFLEGVN